MSFSVKMQGHGVKELSKALRGFAADIKAINRRSLMKVGLKAERIAVQHIQAQDLNWAPLKPHYVAWKTEQGHSEKTLIKTSTYLQSISSWPSADGNSVGVGVSKDAKEADGQLVASIAAVLEFGSITRNIPARPLWGPSLREVADWLASTDFFAVEIINGLKKKYAGGADTAGAAAAGEAAKPTTTAKPGRAVSTGSRGGKYYLSASGRKVYQSRKK